MYRIIARGVLLFLCGVLVLVIAFMTTALLQTYRQYQAAKERESALVAQLDGRYQELQVRQEYLRLVLEDPAFLERVVREKLGYARPNETIFRFED